MTALSKQPLHLAGDIGATKTTLALYRPDDPLLTPCAEITVENDSVRSFDEIIGNFLRTHKAHPVFACFGVAGPVTHNRVKMTNLAWNLDGSNLQEDYDIPSVTLINDLVATALGAVNLNTDSLLTINKGQKDFFGAIGVVAPGTGLGEAFLIQQRDNWLPVASEGGHSSFAPTNDQQRRLLNYMSDRHPHVSTELVCSGIGIPNLYDFLCAEKKLENNLTVHPDSTKTIIESALSAQNKNDKQDIALQTLQLFVSILASEAANLALKVLATGGLYIGGGIPLRILPILESKTFLDTFARGEYREMLAAIPIHIILEPKTALIGAAAYGRALFPEQGTTV